MQHHTYANCSATCHQGYIYLSFMIDTVVFECRETTVQGYATYVCMHPRIQYTDLNIIYVFYREMYTCEGGGGEH